MHNTCMEAVCVYIHVYTMYMYFYNEMQVRLLTGIGRFYEMSYILQLLMENDQFESLLHTGTEKVHV